MKIMSEAVRQPQQGSATILMVGGMVALIAFVGLALDVGIGYLARAKLSTAVDGAVLAASQAVLQGSDRAEQIRNAERTAQAFFSSTFPAGTLGMRVSAPVTHVFFDPIGGTRITVSAQAEGAVSFLRVLGFSALPIAASAETRRSSVDLVMVTDMSSSILSTPNWQYVVKDSLRFFQLLSPPVDRAAQVIYAENPLLLVKFRQTPGFSMADIQNAYNQMNTPFPALAGFAGGNTSTAPALAFALHEFSKITSPASTRVLLLFTDGIANRGCLGGIDAVSLGCSVSDLPYSIAQGQMASQIQLALKQGIRVFVIGFGAELTDPKNAVHMGGKTGEQVLVSALNLVSKDSAAAANPALKSGLYCAADDPVSLQRCFDGYASDLLRLSR